MVGFTVALVLVAAACGGKKVTRAAGAAAPQRGGVYRTALDDFGLTGGFDPTGEYVAIAFNSYNAILRTLVATRHVAAPAGNVLYPDLAARMPDVSPDRLTYTFTLKQGIKFGPPLHRPITSKDIEYAFERINTKSLVAQYGFYYDGVIKGMDGNAPKPAPVSGIETPNDQTIVFHLTHPVGDFLYRLAMPATAPIPREVAGCFSKAGDYGRYVIASGPYMIQGSDKLDASSCKTLKPISGFDPTAKLILVRNPDYDQSTDTLRSNWVDGIQILVDTNVADIFSRIDRGELDGSLANQPPKTTLVAYERDPGKRQYVHADPGDDTWYLTMNLAHPPFDDLHVRKAVNDVLDKAAILQDWGGPVFGQIATHVIPPTMLNGQLGQSYDPYATPGFHGDLAKAKDEMRQSRYDANKDGVCDAPVCRNLVMVNRNVAPFIGMEPIVTQDLAKIGIQVTPREYSTSAAYRTIQSVKDNVPLALHAQWIKDYADPFTFANPLFGSGSIIPEGNVNYSLVGLTPSMASKLGIAYPAGASIPSVDRDIDACEQVPAGDPARTTCWVNFDKKLMEQVVPWVPYLWGDNITITAPSVTHYVYDQSSSYISLTQLAVSNKVSAASLS
jgi:peptide/nickel transport system substrate-binding protein